MRGERDEIPPGTLEMLILTTLATGPAKHGFEVAESILSISEDVLQVNQGSLYPALHRLEEQGWISASWKISENNRQAKYYTLTKLGHRQLVDEKDNWIRLSSAVARIVGA